MVIFPLLAILALVICLEMERYALRYDRPGALLGGVLVALAAACAVWAGAGGIRFIRVPRHDGDQRSPLYIDPRTI